mmetsp:Transcript_24168/g.35818  ORF Transcript_24168/g.35818 Transcript_24168/m.35818 type:complete len:488 (+) Transcript_24168:64-1527(+)
MFTKLKEEVGTMSPSIAKVIKNNNNNETRSLESSTLASTISGSPLKEKETGQAWKSSNQDVVSLGNSTLPSTTIGSPPKGEVSIHSPHVPKTVAIDTATAFTATTPLDEETQVVIVLEAAGGTDKDPSSGHRRDTIPIRNALLNQGCLSQVLQYQEEDSDEARAHNDDMRSKLLESSAVVVRVNPGTLSVSTQAKLDALLMELHEECGVLVMSPPDAMQRMGAKDALCKIKHLACGLEDTAAYYNADEFRAGFCKSIAFQPRVLKQNRGSQGEGIWICRLENEDDYCATFGDKIAPLDTPLVLSEANDNHTERHTLGEFLEFCINGRTEQSGEWFSLGHGRYLEGENGMLVDQRFLPRISEGEIRCLMVGENLINIVHKKPSDGNFSATLQSGAKYTSYAPDAPEFANLVTNFERDLPHMMNAFGIDNVPLLWTADYILGPKDECGLDTYVIGEFNCSCVGITQNLEHSDLVAQTAIANVFMSEDQL